MSDKVDVKLTLEVNGQEKVDFTLNYKGTSLDTVVAIENGLADLIKDLNAKG